MRRKEHYIHQLADWPAMEWDGEKLQPLLLAVRFRQGKLLGKMEGLGFALRSEATLETITQDVLKSSEIEGEILNPQQVRSSVARKLGLDIAGLVHSDRHVDGVVEMSMNATQFYNQKLTTDRLFGWHASLFPGGRSGMLKIATGTYRNHDIDHPMQVVSGPLGKEKVHFQAPHAHLVKPEMQAFLQWFNQEKELDEVLKAGVAHLWFLTIHPFDDGNGRIARALSDMLLCRADNSSQRFYSMSSQIRKDRKNYYEVLEKTQRGSLDITAWLLWYLRCLEKALNASEKILFAVLQKAAFWEKFQQHTFNERQVRILNKLLDDFDGKLTTSKWAKMTKTSQDTALRDIQDLLQRGVLSKDNSGGRSTSYLLSPIKMR